MIYLYVRQTVLHYPVWKELFDGQLAARQAGGATKEMFMLRNVDNSHEIVVLLGWCDLHQAQLFIKSVNWQMAQRQMGVVGSTEVRFLEWVD